MATFHLEIDTSGSAFCDVFGDPSTEQRNIELTRLLRRAADRIADGAEEVALRDTNGNRIGSAWLEDTE